MATLCASWRGVSGAHATVSRSAIHPIRMFLPSERCYPWVGEGAAHLEGFLEFTYEKWSGLGNDFILVESLPPGVAPESLCDSSRGLSADGLLLVTPPSDQPARLIIYNRDGSRPEMCGNGLRCVVRYLFEAGYDLTEGVVTDIARHEVKSVQKDQVCVTVGTPRWWSATGSQAAAFEDSFFYGVDVGNPHAIFFSPNPQIDLISLGERMQQDHRFPEGTNVHVVHEVGGILQIRHFERGVGVTQACGTGAAAAAWAAVQANRSQWPVRTHLPGGELIFDQTNEGFLLMTGSAERIGGGTLSLG
ncbi:MAG: diaminopimelate epimerase [Myxococcales bacterium]|nr:diaminopimelate epimerase [Myxococcales bacterium]